MKEQSLHLSLEELNALFEQLNPLDVEQFYSAYQLWSTRQRIQILQAQLQDIQLDIVENAQRLEQVYPSALALATLARLQSDGVSNVDVLDRMLERGEEWLDRTMQRLEYCEKMDVISGNYTKWCELALEGAYDWIDSMLGQDTVDVAILSPALSATPVSADNESIEIEATHENGEPTSAMMEELFLQKLMSDDREEVNEAEEVENDTPLLETTLKMDALLQPTRQEPVPDTKNAQPAPSELPMLPTESDTRPEAVESTPVLAEVQAEHTEVTSMAVEGQEEQQPVLLHMEDRHEAIEQPEIVVETRETLDTLEPVDTNEPHMEISPEREADAPVVEHSEQSEQPQTGLQFIQPAQSLDEQPGHPQEQPEHPLIQPAQSLEQPGHPLDGQPGHPQGQPEHPLIQPAQSLEQPGHPLDGQPGHPQGQPEHPLIQPAQSLEQPGHPLDGQPGHPQGDAPTIYATVGPTDNEIGHFASVSAPAPTSVEMKQKRGFLRTLVAVLFHV